MCDISYTVGIVVLLICLFGGATLGVLMMALLQLNKIKDDWL